MVYFHPVPQETYNLGKERKDGIYSVKHLVASIRTLPSSVSWPNVTTTTKRWAWQCACHPSTGVGWISGALGKASLAYLVSSMSGRDPASKPRWVWSEKRQTRYPLAFICTCGHPWGGLWEEKGRELAFHMWTLCLISCVCAYVCVSVYMCAYVCLF